MIAIQIIVILVALGLLLFVLGGSQTHSSRAWKKIAFFMLAITMIITVIFPDVTTQAAHVVGVGRGADLLLYILALAFIWYVLNSYIHQQRDKDTVFRLARKVALLDATSRYGMNSKSKNVDKRELNGTRSK